MYKYIILETYLNGKLLSVNLEIIDNVLNLKEIYELDINNRVQMFWKKRIINQLDLFDHSFCYSYYNTYHNVLYVGNLASKIDFPIYNSVDFFNRIYL